MDDSRTAEDSVRKWLQSEGYPLEFRVAKALRMAGFETRQGAYYIDQQLSPPTPREIDVVANWPTRPDVRVVVECKMATKPWVVLTEAAAIDPPEALSALIATDLAKVAIGGRLEYAVGWQQAIPRFFAPAPERGFSVVVSNRDPKAPDVAFRAISQVTAAAASLVPDAASVALAVVVIKGRLFRVGLAADGSDIVDEVPWQRVLWHGTAPSPSCVDIVTEDELPARAAVLAEAVTQICAILGPQRPR